jgi:hypothetical protein
MTLRSLALGFALAGAALVAVESAAPGNWPQWRGPNRDGISTEKGKFMGGPDIRNAGKSSAAVVYADGRLYYRYENGKVILIEATSDAYREHGSLDIPNVGGPRWPHPAVAGGKLYLREQDNLFAYHVAK